MVWVFDNINVGIEWPWAFIQQCLDNLSTFWCGCFHQNLLPFFFVEISFYFDYILFWGCIIKKNYLQILFFCRHYAIILCYLTCLGTFIFFSFGYVVLRVHLSTVISWWQASPLLWMKSVLSFVKHALVLCFIHLLDMLLCGICFECFFCFMCGWLSSSIKLK